MRNKMTIRELIADGLHDIYHATPDDGADLLPDTRSDDADQTDFARWSLQTAINANQRGHSLVDLLLLLTLGAFIVLCIPAACWFAITQQDHALPFVAVALVSSIGLFVTL